LAQQQYRINLEIVSPYLSKIRPEWIDCYETMVRNRTKIADRFGCCRAVHMTGVAGNYNVSRLSLARQDKSRTILLLGKKKL